MNGGRHAGPKVPQYRDELIERLNRNRVRWVAGLVVKPDLTTLFEHFDFENCATHEGIPCLERES